MEEQDDEKTILAKAVRILNRTLEQKDVLLRRKEELLEEQRPKVEFADALTTGDGCILISELAKLLTRNGFVTGRTRLYRWMRSTDISSSGRRNRFRCGWRGYLCPVGDGDKDQPRDGRESNN